LLSGKYPARTKLITVWDGGEQPPDERLLEVSKPILERMIRRGNAQYREGLHRHALPLSEYTFAQALRDGGYATAHFGKWHVGLQPGFRPRIAVFRLPPVTGGLSKGLPDISARTSRGDSPAWRI